MPYPVNDNRELSWLKFNERVLEEAEDKNVPLAERLVFSSIFSSNLDEFYMVRVGSLTDQMLLDGKTKENKTNMTAKEQLLAINKRVSKLVPKKDNAYNSILKELEKVGVKHVSFKDISQQDLEFLDHYYNYEVMPLISAQVIDKRHPFPFLGNKEIFVVVKLESKSNIKLGMIKASGIFNRVVYLPGDGIRFILIEELILRYARDVFKNYEVEEKALICVTRNADINVEEGLVDYDLDFRSVMTQLIKKRKKLSPVRLEASKQLSEDVLKELCDRLDLEEKDIFITKTPLDMSFVFSLNSKLSSNKQLFFTPYEPQNSRYLIDCDNITKQVLKRDILLSYPYESIKPFIKLLNESANDPDVVSIKITLYRVAKTSKVVEALIDAAENGKDVLVLVELRARFDEENNIDWSKRLEEAGCRVIYGPENLKVHSKLLLITRKVQGKLEYITQIGTGNYNEKTSKLYTDYCLMTSNNEIASDAQNVFNALSTGNLVEYSKHLLVAPLCLQNKIIDMLDNEIRYAQNGEPAYFGAKLNSLSDKVLIDKLVEASKAGVKIDLIVRGICCLVAGIKGETENIRIISIVGRFLEHSRVYIAGTDSRRRVYISSADFMTRNTTRRVEVAVPLFDEELRNRVVDMFNIMFKDNVKARIQLSDGTYKKKTDGLPMFDSQNYFYREAYEKAPKFEKNKLIQKKQTFIERVLKIFKR